jgi:effector-binding domain-containing protein
MSLDRTDESANSSSFGDETSHSAGTHTSSGDSRKTDESIEGIREELAKKETIAVCRLRVLVIVVLICAATAVCLVVFFTTKYAEEDEFDIQYEGVAEKVIQSFGDIIVEMAAISGLGVAASAHSLDHTSKWPYTTLSNFQQRAGNARALSGVLYVSINPLVTDDELRPAWEEYVNGPESQWM